MTLFLDKAMKPKHQYAGFATLCATLVLSACANIGPQTPDSLVTQRANTRWQALVAGKFDDAYSFNTLGFRALVTPEAYRGRIGTAVKWVAAEVNKVNCPLPDKCDVRIRLDYKPLMNAAGGANYTTYIDESWILENSQWWIHQPIAK